MEAWLSCGGNAVGGERTEHLAEEGRVHFFLDPPGSASKKKVALEPGLGGALPRG